LPEEQAKEAEREKPIEPPSKISRTKDGEIALEFPPDERSRLGLKTAPLLERSEPPEVASYGRVVSPASLLALEADLGSAQAALPASKAEFERMKTLFQENGNASRKAFEAAQAQFETDQNRLKSVLRQISAEWGDVVTSLAPNQREGVIDKLAKREIALVRVTVLPGTKLPARPTNARLTLLGEEEHFFTTSRIFDTSQADPKSQGRGFMLRVDDAGPALTPGAAVTAYLRSEGDPLKGVEIPPSAIIRFAGKTWVYLLVDERHFVRREVTLDRPTKDGWFTTSALGDKNQVLVEGPGTLLSEELKAQIHVEQ
jgi:multidrug efflux pump subunit AcrA (membrane-fusion protein)